ncbi:MAG: glycosyltransferase family 2 protein, partial [Chroococcales cyanobacterium metabat2.561]
MPVLISVVIPTYNREAILKKCLIALENQRLTDNKVENYEIVLVDDGSTDATIAWLESQKANLPHLQLWQQDHGGPAIARNLGVEKARGDTIIFI